MQQPPLGRSHVLIVGTARDCEAALGPSVARLRAAFAGAARLSWFVVESDSRDGTAACLARLADEVPGFAWESLGTLQDRLPARTERLAFCRNRCLDHARGMAEAAQEAGEAGGDAPDWIVVADLDGVNHALRPQGVASCWAEGGWDACAANQDGPYYDVWALRHPVWSPDDCWRAHDVLAKLSGPKAAYAAAVAARQITVRPDAGFIEVDSAFGGLAIYRRAMFEGCAYAGRGPDGREICEHVPFHAQARARGARLVLNAALINASRTEHTPLAFRSGRGLRRAVRRLAALARRIAAAGAPGR